MPAREFKRIVLGLHQSLLDRATFELAAGFAGLLRTDMFGFFIEEPHLKVLAELPHAREFRMGGRRWEPLDVARFAREFEASALAAKRLLTEAAAVHRVACSFEVVRSPTAQAIRTFSRASDILIIAEPKSPVDRIAGPFPGLASAALQSAASVLLVPRQVARMQGPVVAVAAAPDDPALDAALAVAAAAGESLVVLAAHDVPMDAGAVETLPLSRAALASAGGIAAVLGGVRERMIVLTRADRAEAVPTALASLRRVPVLVLAPPAEADH